MKGILSMLLLFMLTTVQLTGQQYLYVKKSGKLPLERLAVHDKLKIRISDTTSWVKGSLEAINSESIKVDGQVFLLKEVKTVRVYNDLIKLGGTALLTGGVLFTSIALFNGIINGDDPVIYPRQLILGAGLAGGGLLIRWLSRKTYSRDEGYSFEVIDLEKDYQP